jgi:dienelactone hydrolase
MADTEHAEIEIGGGKVRGTLHKPANGSAGTPFPAVVICRGVHSHGEEAQALIDRLVRELSEHGIAALTFDHRCADLILDDFDVHCAAHDAQDAQAMLCWLLEQPSVDRTRMGALGYSLGAIAAAAVARNNHDLAAACLLAAPTAAFMHERVTKSNGSAGLCNPEHLPAAYLPSMENLDVAKDFAFHNRLSLVIHGAADTAVRPEISLEYQRACEAADHQCQRVLIARGDHTFSAPEARMACVEQVVRFFSSMERRAVAAPAVAGGS